MTMSTHTFIAEKRNILSELTQRTVQTGSLGKRGESCTFDRPTVKQVLRARQGLHLGELYGGGYAVGRLRSGGSVEDGKLFDTIETAIAYYEAQQWTG